MLVSVYCTWTTYQCGPTALVQHDKGPAILIGQHKRGSLSLTHCCCTLSLLSPALACLALAAGIDRARGKGRRETTSSAVM